MKKTITVLFSTHITKRLNNDIIRDLTLVFGNSVELNTMYLPMLSPGDTIPGDAILVLRPSVKELLHPYVNDPSRIIVVTRTLTEESVYRLYHIPRGERVLVVNESRETTMETVSMLHILGIEHLKLIPYLGYSEDITDIQTAITPGEAHLVPPFISHLIDVGNRRLDMQTFLDLFDLLQLNSPQIKQNLIHYADTIIELHNGVKKRYTESYTLNETLCQTLNLQKNGVIVTDDQFSISYWNNSAERMLEATPTVQEHLGKYFSQQDWKKMQDASFSEDLFTINNCQYMVSRVPLLVMQHITGYSFLFESAAQIRKIGSELSSRLKRHGLTARYTFHDILYGSAAMSRCVSIAKKVAASDYTILITGETGTGKEMFAQAIHNASARKNMPFVAVNCAALPETLLESELFGYEEGAFTGARRGGKIGLFEQADGGTIFLDEIGDMPYPLQSKLLRVLQEQQIVRLGGNTVIKVNVRILTATNCDLKQMIQMKKFREDLFYHLNVFPLQLIPLRQRCEDILPLFCVMSKHKEEDILPEHRAILKSYPWPGNVRELQNTADYYCLMGTLDCLSCSFQSASPPEAPPQTALTYEQVREMVLEILRSREQQMLRTGRPSLIRQLQSRGVVVSEKKLEQILQSLLNEGCINRGRGRAGITLA